jgi:hypothetical protein
MQTERIQRSRAGLELTARPILIPALLYLFYPHPLSLYRCKNFASLLRGLQLDKEKQRSAVPETLMHIGVFGGRPVFPIGGVARQQNDRLDGHHVGQIRQPDFHRLMEKLLQLRIIFRQEAHLINDVAEFLVRPAIEIGERDRFAGWLDMANVVEVIQRSVWIAHRAAVAPEERFGLASLVTKSAGNRKLASKPALRNCSVITGACGVVEGCCGKVMISKVIRSPSLTQKPSASFSYPLPVMISAALSRLNSVVGYFSSRSLTASKKG